MQSRLRPSAFTGALATAFLFAASSSASAAGVTFNLDAANPTPGAVVAGPVQSPTSLIAGKVYVARVSGTVSLWTAQNFSSRSRFTICGTPDSAPLYLGTNGKTGRAGVDAEFRYAFPIPRGACPALPQVSSSTFKFDTGSGFYDPAPFPGAVNHSYKYGLVGGNKRLAAEFTDVAPQDNYGSFKIYLRAGRDSDCLRGGWANFPGITSMKACKAATRVKAPTV